MSRDFVLVEIENGCESDTTAVGGSELVGIVIDWDTAEIDRDYASSMVEEILGRYYPGETPEPPVQAVLDRLEENVAELDDVGSEDEEDEDDSDSYEDEDADLDEEDDSEDMEL